MWKCVKEELIELTWLISMVGGLSVASVMVAAAAAFST
jgi:hypothetical protein